MITRRERFFCDNQEGDLIYNDYDGVTVERTADRIIVKIVAERETNWLQLADYLSCSLIALGDWAFDRRGEGKENFSELETIQRDEDFEAHRCDELQNKEGGEFLYSYFYDKGNWVMYENECQYLFLYEMEIKDMYPLTGSCQMDALEAIPADEMGLMTMFLRSWYDRVNGYPNNK